VAVALSMNIPIMKIEAHVPSVKNDRGRLNIIPGKKESVIIDDTYNASQPSMEVALNLLLERKCRRRIAILGDMLELGSLEETAHAEILDQAIQIGDIIILIGERFARIASKKQQENLYLFSDVYDAKENIHAVFTPSFGDCILLKGSASIRLEKIAEDLIDSSISAKNTLVRQEKRWK